MPYGNFSRSIVGYKRSWVEGDEQEVAIFRQIAAVLKSLIGLPKKIKVSMLT